LSNINKVERGAGGEIQLTDAIAYEIEQGRDVHGFRFEGQRYDCGSKLGYIEATVAFALDHPELRDDFSDYLQSMAALKSAAQ